MLLQDIGERTADERLEGHGLASVAACLTPIGREPGQPATCEGRPTGGVAWRKAGQLGAQLRGRTFGAYEVDEGLAETLVYGWSPAHHRRTIRTGEKRSCMVIQYLHRLGHL